MAPAFVLQTMSGLSCWLAYWRLCLANHLRGTIFSMLADMGALIFFGGQKLTWAPSWGCLLLKILTTESELRSQLLIGETLLDAADLHQPTLWHKKKRFTSEQYSAWLRVATFFSDRDPLVVTLVEIIDYKPCLLCCKRFKLNNYV